MAFVVSRDPRLSFRLLWPSLAACKLPVPVQTQRSTTTYHFWARNALYHGLRILGLKAGDKVLVPAFHCQTMIEPVLHFGCEIIFYNVTREGVVDFEDIVGKIDDQTKAIIAIHYFGVLQPAQTLRAFCDEHHLLLVEDCAHVLLGDIGGRAVGSFGDVSIFSWRKFFPIYDGGLLVCNNGLSPESIPFQSIDTWFQLKIAKNLLEKCLGDRQTGMKAPSHSPSRSLQRQNESSSVADLGPKQDLHHSPSGGFDFMQVNWPMSRLSKRILMKIDIPAVVQKRKAYSTKLFNAVSSLSGVEPWASVGKHDVCAWGFPIVAREQRDVHVRLRDKGIQAFSWDGVIHPSLPLEQFPDAKFLYDHVVLLPNHQSLTQEEQYVLVSEVEDVIRSGKQQRPEGEAAPGSHKQVGRYT